MLRVAHYSEATEDLLGPGLLTALVPASSALLIIHTVAT